MFCSTKMKKIEQNIEQGGNSMFRSTKKKEIEQNLEQAAEQVLFARENLPG